MKKLLFSIASILSFTLSASAHCGSCEGGEKKCDKSAQCEAKTEEAFKKHDVDKDGKLSLVEFKALMADCAEECDKSECKKEEGEKK